MNPLHSPEGWLLLAEMNGKPVCVNLWEAIEAGMLLVQVNPLARIRVLDIAGDVPEHRAGRDYLVLPGNPLRNPFKPQRADFTSGVEDVT